MTDDQNLTENIRKVEEKNFPFDGEMSQKLQFLLNYAILSPSGHNSQPWKFKVFKDELYVLPDYTRIRTKVDPDNRELFITLGAAAKNIELSANYFGLSYKKAILSDTIVYKFKENQDNSKVDSDLFKAITKRKTEKKDFLGQPVEKLKLDRLKSIGNEKVWVVFFEDAASRALISKVIHDGDLVWYKSRDLMNELEEWLRDDIENSEDGLPTGVINMYKIAVEAKYLFSRNSSVAKNKARNDYQMAMAAPVLALVVSQNDEMSDWIESGEIYETLALKLTSMGLSNGLFNSVIELNGQRQKLMRELGLEGHAQMLLRIGYPLQDGVTTPRRPIDEVIIH